MKSIVFFGSSPFSVIVLEKLLHSDQCSVISVVTKPDKPSGRGQKLTPNPVKVLADKHNIPVTQDLRFMNHESKFANQIGLVAAYGKIIPQSVLDQFPTYNIHPSLLPKYRGPSPLQAQILDAATVTGVTIIQLDAEMDHGPIVAQETDEIRPDDTWITLGERLFAKGAELFINSQFTNPKPQNHDEATYTKLITRQDGFVPWNEFEPSQLDTKLRAFTDWPGVWTLMPDGRRLKLISLKPEVLVQVEGKTPQPWPLVV